MTIGFGRRRLILTLDVQPPAGGSHPSASFDPRHLPFPLGATDAELASPAVRMGHDIERARWEALTLVYGGARRR